MAKSVGKLARRYARALLLASQDVLGTDGSPTPQQSLATELEGLAQLWREDRELASTFVNPMFTIETRERALEVVIKETKLSDSAAKFLRLLFNRGRIDALPEMVRAFAIEADLAADVVRVEVVTARVIELGESKEIETAVKEKIGGKPVFDWKVDPEIIGGLVIKFAGKVLDGSLKGRLKRLEKDLA